MWVWRNVNESKMPYLVGLFNHSVFLENPVWRKSKWVWKDIERDRKEIEIFKNDICFYHLRDYQSDRESLAQRWPSPVLWRSMWLECRLILLRRHWNQLFFEWKCCPKKFFCSPLIYGDYPHSDTFLLPTKSKFHFSATHCDKIWENIYNSSEHI